MSEASYDVKCSNAVVEPTADKNLRQLIFAVTRQLGWLLHLHDYPKSAISLRPYHDALQAWLYLRIALLTSRKLIARISAMFQSDSSTEDVIPRRLSPGRSAAVLRQFLHLEGAIGSPASPALETGDKRSFRNGVGKRKDEEEARLVETIPQHQGATELKAEATVFSQNGGHDDIEGTKAASDKRSFRNGVGKRTHFRIVADASLDGLDEPEALRQTGSDVSSPALSRDPWEDVQEKGDEQTLSRRSRYQVKVADSFARGFMNFVRTTLYTHVTVHPLWIRRQWRVRAERCVLPPRLRLCDTERPLLQSSRPRPMRQPAAQRHLPDGREVRRARNLLPCCRPRLFPGSRVRLARSSVRQAGTLLYPKPRCMQNHAQALFWIVHAYPELFLGQVYALGYPETIQLKPCLILKPLSYIQNLPPTTSQTNQGWLKFWSSLTRYRP
ncbi:hypothetical protein Bbelb_315160 [Branchiostoma belcheri]|nr:hypothetical protein Bbelb_315160 [Branchiostoma belcheri]